MARKGRGEKLGGTQLLRGVKAWEGERPRAERHWLGPAYVTLHSLWHLLIGVRLPGSFAAQVATSNAALLTSRSRSEMTARLTVTVVFQPEGGRHSDPRLLTATPDGQHDPRAS
jgi:hypothetical protein